MQVLAGYRPKCLIKQVGFSLDLKDVSESAAVTMSGREFQVVDAVQRKARPENAVLWNGTDSNCGTVELQRSPTQSLDTLDIRLTKNHDWIRSLIW